MRYGECDPQGIVFNANYLLYFDVAVTELWRTAVGPWQEMVDRGVDIVVAEANLTFRAPAPILTGSADTNNGGAAAPAAVIPAGQSSK